MLPEKPLTPEKQLLKLIEEPAAKNTINLAAVKHHGLSLFSVSAWAGRGSFFKHRFQKWLKAPRLWRPDIKAINTILMAIAVVLGVSFIVNFSASVIKLKKSGGLTFKTLDDSKHAEGVQEHAVFRKPVAYYLEKMAARDIFKMGVKKRAAPEQGQVNSSASRILELTQHLKLVGISWSSDPDAMIEDTRALKTFFVKRGEMIGDIKVQAIFKDKVVLVYSGEEIELK